jgi:hypothetical protein
MPEFEDVNLGNLSCKHVKKHKKYLEEIGEVDEHVIPCLLLAARDIETDGNNIEGFATFREFVLDREGVHPCGSQADNIGEPKDVGYTLYPFACCLDVVVSNYN